MVRWGIVVLVATGMLLAPGARADARAMRPEGTPLRIVVLPVQQRGERLPPRRGVARTFRRARAWYRRESRGRIDLRYTIAPPIDEATAQGGEDGPAVIAMRRAAERGVDVAGAVPVLIEATGRPSRSYGSPSQIQIRGQSWRNPDAVVHELGHALGLDHARGPTACARPFDPFRCLVHPRQVHEYGDVLDVMGDGAAHFGAYPLAVLGLAALRDAPAGRAVTALRPLEARRPALLRLRTAAWDYLVDTRRGDRERATTHRVRAPRGAAIERVRPRYVPAGPLHPSPMRVPATDPQHPCYAGTPACLARQIFRPGRRFTVPGTVRLRVLRGGGPLRVATTWLDHSPPSLRVTGAEIVRPAGGAPVLALSLRAAAAGAGIARVEVEQGGTVSAVDPDTIPGLVKGARGRGTIRVALGAAPVARVRALDAAGNASPWAEVALATVPARAGATVSWDPGLGPFDAAATLLSAGQAVTVRGRTDPALAGAFVYFEAIGSALEQPEIQVGADGTFAATWTAPRSGLFTLRVRVPVARAANGIDYRLERFQGWVRG